jgi:uncharacterized protein YegP (UPF0339 family)
MPGESHFEIFAEDADGDPQYRWRFRSANGRVQATSGDGFSTPSHANDAIHELMSAINREHPHPPIIEVDVNGERI